MVPSQLLQRLVQITWERIMDHHATPEWWTKNSGPCVFWAQRSFKLGNFSYTIYHKIKPNVGKDNIPVPWILRTRNDKNVSAKNMFTKRSYFGQMVQFLSMQTYGIIPIRRWNWSRWNLQWMMFAQHSKCKTQITPDHVMVAITSKMIIIGLYQDRFCYLGILLKYWMFCYPVTKQVAPKLHYHLVGLVLMFAVTGCFSSGSLCHGLL